MIPKETKLPKAYDIFDQVLDRGDAQELARILSCSPQLVRGWCRRPEVDEDYKSTGRFSPLDRLRAIISFIREEDGTVTRAYPIGQYIARLLGGVFVPMSPACSSCDSEMMHHISSILQESGEVISKVREIWCEQTPGHITQAEAAQARQEIDDTLGALVGLRQWIDKMESQR